MIEHLILFFLIFSFLIVFVVYIKTKNLYNDCKLKLNKWIDEFKDFDDIKNKTTEKNSEILKMRSQFDHCTDFDSFKTSMDQIKKDAHSYINLKQDHEQLKKDLEHLLLHNGQLTKEIELYRPFKEQCRQKDTEIEELRKLNTRIAQLEEQNKALKKTQESIDSIKTQCEAVFKNASRDALDNQKNHFTDHFKNNILKSLETQMKTLEQHFNQSIGAQNAHQASIKEAIKDMLSEHKTIKEVTENLTTALKGNSKMRGDWGEHILITLLESVGMEENREFEVQPHYRIHEKELIPDVVIQLPHDQKLIIDSKMSFNDFNDYCSAQSKEEEKICLNKFLQSVKNQIKDLSEKSYNTCVQGSLDFVIMFIPLDPAYQLATRSDVKLYEFAYHRKIFLAPPSALFATLKMIATMHNHARQEKNIEKILKYTINLHKKLINFCDSMNEIGNSLDSAKKNFDEAYKRLKNGKGNALSILSKLEQYIGEEQRISDLVPDGDYQKPLVLTSSRTQNTHIAPSDFSGTEHRLKGHEE